MDGTGRARFAGALAARDGKIAEVWEGRPPEGAFAAAHRTLDAQGRLLSPGFIDAHRHADAALFRPGFGEVERAQGITTIVNGNCGMSAAPCPPEKSELIAAYLGPVLGSLPEAARFGSFAEYQAAVAGLKPPSERAVNVYSLVGSGTLRAAAAGFAPALDAAAIRRLHALLEDALGAGALGVSVGLSYQPDSLYNVDSLVSALAPLRGSGRPLVAHIRGEGGLLYDSVAEVLEVSARLDVPLHISHFKCIGERNRGGLLAKTLALLESAREAGRAVDLDVYPWTAGSTQMACLLPPRFLEGGFEAASRRLRDRELRADCRAEMASAGKDWENIAYDVGWQRIYVSAVRKEENRSLVGKSVAAFARERGLSPADAALDLLASEDCAVTMVDFITTESDIETILRLPYSACISDALYNEGGLPHPRGFANTAMLFGEYVEKRKTLTLEEAVRKITGLPAAQFGLRGKGSLKVGSDADLCLWREGHLHSGANYLEPACLTEGVETWVASAACPAPAPGASAAGPA